MGRSIFISYKYGDKTVYGQGMTVRNYVDELQRLLEKENVVNKGEDDADLSKLEGQAIRKKLAERVFDSTVTIVVISPNMKKRGSEKNQWLPWEVSYSLKTGHREIDKSNPNAMVAVILPDAVKVEHRGINNSNPNAMVAVVLPDANGSYEYYIEENVCPNCDSRTLKTETLFPILNKNMFNIKKPQYNNCTNHKTKVSFTGESSYIGSVKWDDFIVNVNYYINSALKRQSSWNDYQINTQLE